jgi:hypothetical protein
VRLAITSLSLGFTSDWSGSLRLERQRVPPNQIAARARRDEIRLIHALIEGGEGGGGGVIGAVVRERLKQPPSYAYWNVAALSAS